MSNPINAPDVQRRSRVVFSVALCAALVCWSQRAGADPPAGYYDSVDTSTPATLRATLHEVIDDHFRFPYSIAGDTDTDTWTIIEAGDEDPNNANNVLTVYRNRSHAKNDHWSSNNSTGWNREHSWPKSFGFTRDGKCNYPYTDIHHLLAANGDYNSARSNLPFNLVPSPEQSFPVDNDPSSNHCFNCDANQDGDWEVWPGRRGDIARAQLYMDVRYEGGTHGVTGCDEPELILTNDRNLMDWNANRNFSPAYMTFLDVLIAWHDADPPDVNDMARNDVVFSFQGNRNPFVDHPEWVGIIWGGGGGGCTTNADCDDADPCTTDVCEANGSCTNTPIDCDDGDACTTDSCSAGVCNNDPISCDDGEACTADSCDPASGCVNTWPACGLADACCEPGVCDSSNDPDCVSCGGNNAPCTQDSDCCSNFCKPNGKCSRP